MKRFLPHAILCTFLGATGCGAHGQAALPQGSAAIAESGLVGKRAAGLDLVKLYQAGGIKDATLESLSGKVIVLEFWATWCAPCIGMMPHMNDLAEKLKGEPIQFLSLSNEKPELVEHFLQKGLMKTWVGVASPKMWENYGVSGIPRTIVIGKDGKVAMDTDPHQVTEERLRTVLRGETPVIQRRQIVQNGQAEPQMMQIELKRTDKVEGIIAGNVRFGSIEATGQSALSLLSLAFSGMEQRVVAEVPLPTGFFDFKFHVPRTDTAAMRTRLVEALSSGLGVHATLEKRKVQVYVVSAPKGPQGDLVQRESTKNWHTSSNTGVLAGKNAPMNMILESIERLLGDVLVDETGLTGGFDYYIGYKDGDKKSLIEGMSKLGLQVTRAEREIEVVVVRK